MKNLSIFVLLTLTLLLCGAVNAFADFSVDSGDTFTLSADETFIVDGDLTIAAGAGQDISAANTHILLSGNWTNNGTFTSGTSSTVTFTDNTVTSTVSGNSGFHNLTCTTAGKNLTFAAGSTQTIANTLDLNGQAAGTEIVLRSSTPGTRYTFDVSGGEQNVSCVDVQDSQSSSNDIVTSNSINSGNNDNSESSPRWVFDAVILDLQKTVGDDNGDTLLAGETLTYTLRLTNNGTGSATNTVISGSIPANTTYVPGSTTLDGITQADILDLSPLLSGLSVGTLTSGEAAVVTFRVRVNSDVATSLAISSQASADCDQTGSPELSDDPGVDGDGNGTFTDEDDPTIIMVGSAPFITAMMRVSDVNGGSVAAGDTLHYTVVINNIGNAAADGVVFSALDGSTGQNLADAAYTAGSIEVDGVSKTDVNDIDEADFGVSTADTVTVNVGSLAAGDSVSIEFDVTVDSGATDGTLIRNQGTVSGNNSPDELTDADGNHANGTQATTVIVGALANLDLITAVDDLNGGSVEAGDTLLYTLIFSNSGSVPASGVTIADTPDTDTSLISGSVTTTAGAVSSGNVAGDTAVGVSAGDVASGGDVTITYQVTVNTVDDGTQITNAATADDTAEPSTPQATNSVTVTVGGSHGAAGVTGRLFLDIDQDDTYDPGEGLEGWTVVFADSNGNRYESTTGSQGSYVIKGLAVPETYTATFYLNGYKYGHDLVIGALTAGDFIIDMDLPIDPSGYVYDSTTGDPIADVTVELYDSGTGLLVPESDLFGTNNPQATTSNGFYQFLFNPGVPAGNTYEIRVTPPVGYTLSGNHPAVTDDVASGLLSIASGGIDAPASGGGNVDDKGTSPFNVVGPNGAQYRYAFEVVYGAGESGEVFQNNIPLDPLSNGSLRLTKTANKEEVSVGSIVTYTVNIENLSAVNDASGVYIEDKIPAGFKYLKGKAILDNAKISDPTGKRPVTFEIGTVSAGQTRVLKYQLIVGSGVSFGKYENKAFAELSNGTVISNVATESVKVVADPLFDLGTVIGKVFWDENENGIQDKGEKPVAYVRIVTENGTVITTDAYGRYHLAGIVPGRHLFRLDERTLPQGAYLTTDKVVITDVTEGILAKVNFGVNLARDLEPDKAPFAVSQNRSTPEPRLNVVLRNSTLVVQDGELKVPAEFRIFTNYQLFMQTWELTIRDKDSDRLVKKFTGTRDDILEPVCWDGKTDTGRLVSPDRHYVYQLSVIGAKNKKDVTADKDITVVNYEIPALGKVEAEKNPEEKQAEYSAWIEQENKINSLDRQAIRIQGETIQVSAISREVAEIRILKGGTLEARIPASHSPEVYATELMMDPASIGTPADRQPDLEIIMPRGKFEIQAEVGRHQAAGLGCPCVDTLVPQPQTPDQFDRVAESLENPSPDEETSAGERGTGLPGAGFGLAVASAELQDASSELVVASSDLRDSSSESEDSGPELWIEPSGEFPGPEESEHIVTVQASSYGMSNLHYAVNGAKGLEEDGYGDVRVEHIGDYYTVRSGVFESRDDAQEIQSEINGIYPTSFIRDAYYIDQRIVYPEHLKYQELGTGGKDAERMRLTEHSGNKKPVLINTIQVSVHSKDKLGKALKNAKLLEDKGYGQVWVESINGLYYVRVGIFENRDEARKIHTRIKEMYPASFVLDAYYTEKRVVYHEYTPDNVLMAPQDGSVGIIPVAMAGAKAPELIWTVQVSSHSKDTLNYALEVAKKFEDKGYGDIWVEFINGLYTVRIGTFENRDDAEKIHSAIKELYPSSFVRSAFYAEKKIFHPDDTTGNVAMKPLPVSDDTSLPDANLGSGISEQSELRNTSAGLQDSSYEPEVTRAVFIEPGNAFGVTQAGLQESSYAFKFASAELQDSSSESEVEPVSADRETETSTETYSQSISVGEDYLFFVGLGDATAGYNFVSGNVEAVNKDDRFQEGFWSEGKLAFYLEGKIKGKYLITSSFDSGRQENDLFENLDPDKYYPVYGDGSTVDNQAGDTEGMLYLLIEWDESSAIWGNYNTELTDTELAQFSRTLYGGKVHLETVSTTRFGDPDAKLVAFQAAARQRAAHNEFTGTGGSLYYLKHRDIIEGSEKVRLEVRDKITGLVLTNKEMEEGADYQINHSQGRIVFRLPVSSLAESDSIISSRLTDGNAVYVVVDYEYDISDEYDLTYEYDEATEGVRVQKSVSDYISLGGTYVNEDQTDGTYELKGADAEIHLGEKMKLTAEYAESKSEALGSYVSNDGGLSFIELDTDADATGKAYGVKGEAQLLEDSLALSAYYKRIDHDFSSAATTSQQGKELIGGKAVYDISPDTRVTVSHDIQELIEDGNAQTRQQVGATRTETTLGQISHDMGKLKLTGEYRHQDVDERKDEFESETNREEESVAAKADYALTEKVDVSLEQQVTLEGEENNQTTAGIEAMLTDSLSVRGKQVVGNQGNATTIGAGANLKDRLNLSGDYTKNYSNEGHTEETLALGASSKLNDKTEVHSNYAFTESDDGDQTASWTYGATQKLNDDLELRADRTQAASEDRHTYSNELGLAGDVDGRRLEGTYTMQHTQGEDAVSDANIFGLSGDINDRWALSGAYEWGEIDNTDGTDIKRQSYSLAAGYVDKDKDTGEVNLKASTKLELRMDRGDESKRQYLTHNAVEWKVDRELTILAKANLSETQNRSADTIEAAYKELSLGTAYRPIYADRLNFLFKYTYLENRGPDSQIGTSDIGDEETAHVLAGEAVIDLNDKWQLTEKLAYKDAEEKVSGFDSTRSQTWLWITRLGYNLDDNWQVAGEYRRLVQEQAEDNKQGFLCELSRVVKDRLQIGVGYNFTEFNDDLTRLDYTSQGPFVRFTFKISD